MRAAIIDTPGKIRVGTISDPTPKPDELVIQVGACGICGTDLHVADGDSPLVRYPVVPGHELAGEVVAVGKSSRRRAVVSRALVSITPPLMRSRAGP